MIYEVQFLPAINCSSALLCEILGFNRNYLFGVPVDIQLGTG